MRFSCKQLEKYLEHIKAMEEFQDEVSESASKLRKTNIGIDVELFLPSFTDDVIELLELITGDSDEWISYFVYELDFGRNYKDGMITDKDGNNIRLESIRDLWALLTNKV